MKKSDIEHIARLAKLKLGDEEMEKLAKELTPVLKHFQDLGELYTDGVEPLVTPVEIKYWMREDLATKTLSADEITANAPERVGNLFKVPPVV